MNIWPRKPLSVVPTNTDDEARFSRSGVSSIGKLCERLDIPVSEELKEAISALATLKGKPASEYARELLEQHVFGAMEIARRRMGD